MYNKFSQFHCNNTYQDNNTYQEQSIAQHKATLEKGFHKDDGVFVQCLDKALASFNVERQGVPRI